MGFRAYGNLIKSCHCSFFFNFAIRATAIDRALITSIVSFVCLFSIFFEALLFEPLQHFAIVKCKDKCNLSSTTRLAYFLFRMPTSLVLKSSTSFILDLHSDTV